MTEVKISDNVKMKLLLLSSQIKLIHNPARLNRLSNIYTACGLINYNINQTIRKSLQMLEIKSSFSL